VADRTATYTAKIESNAPEVARDTGDALEGLRKSILGSTDKLKELNASLRSLRGPSDEVKGLKEKLKAQIDAERNAISAGNVALLKAGTSYEKLAASQRQALAEKKKLDEEQKKGSEKAQAERLRALEESMKSAGGPANDLRGRVDELRKSLSTGTGAAFLAVGAFAALAGAAVELGRQVAGAALEFGKLVAETALAQRQANLQREAWTGSADSAEHLGHQLDALADKVPTPREELQKLAGDTVKALNNSRVSGQGIVDTYNAVGQASAAMGDEAGRALEGIIERGKNFGRISVNPFELQGKGIGVQDIAAQLAKRLHIGLKDALIALQTGRVEVNTGAAAIRDAVEARFGEVNAKMRLGTPLENLKKRLVELTEGIHLDGLLKSIESVEHLLDKSTVSGAVLRTMLEGAAKALGLGNVDAGGLKEILEKVELAAIRLEIKAIRLGKSLVAAFKVDAPELDKLRDQLDVLEPLITGLGVELEVTVKTMGTGLLIAEKFAVALERLYGTLRKVMGAPDDPSAGAVADLQAGARAALAATLGANLNPGGGATQVAPAHAAGGEVMQPAPGEVFASVAPGEVIVPRREAQDAKRGGGGGGGHSIPSKVELHVHMHGQVDTSRAPSAGFLAELTKAVTDILVSAGLPVQKGPTP
jgi:hypothetical protein